MNPAYILFIKTTNAYVEYTDFFDNCVRRMGV